MNAPIYLPYSIMQTMERPLQYNHTAVYTFNIKLSFIIKRPKEKRGKKMKKKSAKIADQWIYQLLFLFVVVVVVLVVVFVLFLPRTAGNKKCNAKKYNTKRDDIKKKNNRNEKKNEKNWN